MPNLHPDKYGMSCKRARPPIIQNVFMQWQATDQFGNLYNATSHAQSLDELRPHIKSLAEELRARVGDAFRLTIDAGYGEINGPDPGRVSHVLKVHWLTDLSPDDWEKVVALAEEVCAEIGIAASSVEMAL